MISPPFTATHIAKPYMPMLKIKLLKECVCPNTQPLNNATKMKELMRKINNKTPTRVTVAQLPLNPKKAHYVTSIHAF